MRQLGLFIELSSVQGRPYRGLSLYNYTFREDMKLEAVLLSAAWGVDIAAAPPPLTLLDLHRYLVITVSDLACSWWCCWSRLGVVVMRIEQ